MLEQAVARKRREDGKGFTSQASPEAAPSSQTAASYHQKRAAEHASAVGGEWDEAKHPRDENGKFG